MKSFMKTLGLIVLFNQLSPDASARFAYVDISGACNMEFKDKTAGDKKGGWLDQGDKDFRSMPVGEQKIHGFRFNIINPDNNNSKSCIVLKGTAGPYFPEKAVITPIDKKAKTICFLHTCGWEDKSFKEAVAYYLITYQDGKTAEIPLHCGIELTDWSPVYDTPKSRVVFRRGQAGINLFLWENPYPGKNIKSITFESKNASAIPVLIAISFSDKKLKLPERRLLLPEKLLNSIPDKLNKNHPRLILTDEGLEKLKKLIKKNKQLSALVEANNKEAARLMDEPTVGYIIPDGKRLLAQSRKCMDRIYCLGLAYRLTGNKKFADRAKKELFAAADFPDWNPSHFLDTAEMSHAFAIGYDWLYHYLEEKDRQKVKEAIIEKGLKPGLECYHNKVSWTICDHNWSLVCNGGLGVASLAIADENPGISTEVLSFACGSVPIALSSYEPDGGWGEGPAYWHYATRYICYFLASLETALKEDFKLTQYKGLKEAGMFRIHSIGPLNMTFNYADADRICYAYPVEEMFWLARRFNKPVYAWHQRKQSGTEKFHPLDIVWFSPEGRKPTLKELPLDTYFRGVEVALLRSSWDDKNAVYVGFKGGSNSTNHAHLDLGSFVLDADGVRWAMDLGSDDYNMPGYFDNKRWQYYRLSTDSHNTLVINGENQDVTGKAKITKHKSSKDKAFAVCDLTGAYRKNAERVSRGVALIDRCRVVIQDEIELKKPGTEILWGMITEADIKIENNKATLTKDNKVMEMEILSPANAEFEIISTKQLPPQDPNKGTKKLAFRLKPAKKSIRLVIIFAPAGTKCLKKPKPETTALFDW
jgi:hypothetical protein